MVKLELTNVTLDNVDKEGFFCYMSKKKSEGYKRKMDWVKARLAEGMRLKIALKDSRAFIEYIPGEHCWRAIEADGYLVIHCLWVVGKARHKKGHGTYLLKQCIEDAKENGFHGVATVTSSKTWVHEKGLFVKNGFESVDALEPFDLMVKRFDDAPMPKFAGDWDKKAAQFGDGFTILRTDQCPYIVDSVTSAIAELEARGFKAKVVEINSRKDVMEKMPFPYGTFAIVRDGKPFSYHYMLPKDWEKFLGES